MNGLNTKEAPWFSVRLTRKTAPWAFARGDPFRTIAALELLGALVGVIVLLPPTRFDRSRATTGLITIGCGTDSQGNTFLLDKLLTTKYPLSVVLMELSCQLGLRRAALRANWIPRLQNEEADALTNLDFRHFDSASRIDVDSGKLPFKVLNDLFAEGESYLEELEALRAQDKERKEAKELKKKGPKPEKVTLREREPW